MILTIIRPSASSLTKGFKVEHETYSDDEIKKAGADHFNRMHEIWADTGEIWLVDDGKFDDGVLLSTWAHISGPNFNVVMSIGPEEGETE